MKKFGKSKDLGYFKMDFLFYKFLQESINIMIKTTLWFILLSFMMISCISNETFITSIPRQYYDRMGRIKTVNLIIKVNLSKEFDKPIFKEKEYVGYEMSYIFPDSSIFYFTIFDTTLNLKNYISFKLERDMNQRGSFNQIHAIDTFLILGKNKDGLNWLEKSIENFKIGYLNANESKKDKFNQIIFEDLEIYFEEE